MGGLQYGEMKLPGQIVPHQQELAVLRRLADLLDSGATHRDAAETLRTEGVLTRRGRPITRDNVFAMTRFPAYLKIREEREAAK